MNSPVKTTVPPYITPIKTKATLAEKMKKIPFCSICKKTYKNAQSLACHRYNYHRATKQNVITVGRKPTPEISQDSGDEPPTIVNGYTENLLELASTQQKNTDFINQNTSHLLKLLEITKPLVLDFESSKKYQAKNLKTKTYNCQICNIVYGNSSSLRSHRNRCHRVKLTTDCSCRQCNAVFNNETNLAIHRYRYHRASL